MDVDFKKLKEDALGYIETLVTKWVPDGRVDGHEYVMKNPRRDDDKLGSFKINTGTGVWCDFADGSDAKGSDLVSLYHYLYNTTSMLDAAKAVMLEIGQTPTEKKKVVSKKEVWTPIVPIPVDTPRPFEKHYKHGKASKIWQYRDENGNIVSYIYRFDNNGKKAYSPLTYCECGDKKAWKWKGLLKPRPLYLLDELKVNSDKKIPLNILIVEGEKAADAAKEMVSHAVQVTTWHGGVDNVRNTDWSPLKNTRVVIWPDNDLAGEKAAENIAIELSKIKAKVKIVVNHPKAPAKWDLADALEKKWSGSLVLNHLKKNLREPASNAEPVKKHETPSAPPEPTEYIPVTDETDTNPFNIKSYPFKILGFNGNNYYYLPNGTQQVQQITGTNHDEKNLTSYLAPIDFWEKYWTQTKKRKKDDGEWEEYNGGVDWKAVKRFLIWDLQNKHGVYAGDENLRAQGVWMDDNRVILHLGDRLLCNGTEVSMSKIDSKYIYEKKRSKELNIYDKLPVERSVELIPLVEQFSWSRNINPRLLMGFIVAGLIGGALPWRPHVWINGEQGCGKSSVIKDIVRRILGGCTAIFIEGATTEAGLRQTVNHSSFPILFDEAESNDKKGQLRMDQILELMRSSASPDGGKLLKGTPGGSSMTFDIQSCFCLASVSNNTKLAADLSRIVSLEMKTHESPSTEKWEVFRQTILNTLNLEWTGQFRQRIFSMVPTIRKNIDVFITAVRDELKSQRYGDVYGVLLGSAYAIESDGIIDYETARKFVSESDWSEERDTKSIKDDVNCLVKILQRIVRVSAVGTHEKTIWELMKIASTGKSYRDDADDFDGKADDAVKITSGEANDASRRYGVMYKRDRDGEFIIIANNNYYLEQWLRDSQFSTNWNKWLKRISLDLNGAHYDCEPISARKFSDKEPTSRGVKIPLEVVQHYLEDN